MMNDEECDEEDFLGEQKDGEQDSPHTARAH